MVRKSLLCLAIIGLVPFVLSQQNEEGASVENSIPPVCEYEVFSSNLGSFPVKIKRPSKCTRHYHRYRPNGKKHITPENWSVDGWFFRCPSQKISDITLYSTGNPQMRITCRANYPLNLRYTRVLKPAEPEEDELAGLVVRTEEIHPEQYRIEVEFPRTVNNNQESLSDFSGRFTFFNPLDKSNLQTEMIVKLSFIGEEATKVVLGK